MTIALDEVANVIQLILSNDSMRSIQACKQVRVMNIDEQLDRKSG